MAFEQSTRTPTEQIADRQKGRNLPPQVWAAVVVMGGVVALVTGIPENPVHTAIVNYSAAQQAVEEAQTEIAETQRVEAALRRATRARTVWMNKNDGIADPDGDGNP